MLILKKLAITAAIASTFGTLAHSAEIDNSNIVSQTSTWSSGGTKTYGQVITATPSFQTVRNFTFYVKSSNQVSTNFKAYIYEWDASTLRIMGNALYQSGAQTASTDNAFTAVKIVTGNIQLTPGNRYALFFSTLDVAGNTTGVYNFGSNGQYTDGTLVFTSESSPFNNLLSNSWMSYSAFDLAFLVNSGPSATDALSSFSPNATALRNAFNLESAKISLGLSYDCTIYDQKNICVSFVGSKSDGKGFDATTGALILAHKPTSNFRFGGYIDQSSGTSASGGLTLKNGSPGFGAFGVWSQNADSSGVEVRASANVGKLDMETTRTAVGSAEAGFGTSDIKSSGFQFEVSRDYAINNAWSARPYVGYRKTTNKRTGYTETDAVDFPLTFTSLKQSTETALAGVRFGHQFSQQTAVTLSAGLEHDLKNKTDRYQASNADIGDIDSIEMASNKHKTRPVMAFSLNHNLDKAQRIGLFVTHRKEAFASGSSTSAMVQYSAGF